MGSPLTLMTATLVAALLGAPQALAADPKARDAVDLFIDACVTDVFRVPPTVTDPSRFRSSDPTGDTEFFVENRQRGTRLVEFTFPASRVSLLLSREAGDVCVVRVSTANEADIQAAFAQAVERLAATTRGVATPLATTTHTSLGDTVTTRSWKVQDAKTALILAISTAPPRVGEDHCLAAYPPSAAARQVEPSSSIKLAVCPRRR